MIVKINLYDKLLILELIKTSTMFLLSKMNENPKALFFDRDGVINERIVGGYVKSWNEFHFLPGVGETLCAAKKLGYLCIIISNQRGVGLELMSENDLKEIHVRMQAELLEKYGVKFDDIIYCTDVTNDSLRRKPSPVMLQEAKEKYHIDMAKSWMIGDTRSDIEAGRRAGVKTAFLLNQHDSSPKNATIIINRLSDITDHI